MVDLVTGGWWLGSRPRNSNDKNRFCSSYHPEDARSLFYLLLSCRGVNGPEQDRGQVETGEVLVSCAAGSGTIV